MGGKVFSGHVWVGRDWKDVFRGNEQEVLQPHSRVSLSHDNPSLFGIIGGFARLEIIKTLCEA